MNQETDLSISGSDFLDWLGATNIEFENGKIQRVDISFPVMDNSHTDYPYPYVIHGLVQIVLHKEKHIITSMIHIITVSNLVRLTHRQTRYDEQQNKYCSEIHGIYLSQSDTNEILTYLLNKTAHRYSTTNAYIEPPVTQEHGESLAGTLIKIYRYLTKSKERDFAEYLQ